MNACPRVHHLSCLRLPRFASVLSLRVDPLVPDDTAAYLAFRLGRAGCDRELFTSDATAMLHEATNGAFREIDRLATGALRAAARRRKKLVERDTLAHVIVADTRTAQE